jgi:AcrR family transcriptional regulator
VAFGKPGRPPEDRLARQTQIYQAVGPLLLRVGARRLSMQQAARAACMSVGGLYHYFPGKQELVLHGLQPQGFQRRCHDFQRRCGHLAATQPQRYAEAILDDLADTVLYARPAVLAALELGVFQAGVDGLFPVMEELVAALGPVVPAGTPEPALWALARALRRGLLGALLDRDLTKQELRTQLWALVDGYTDPAHAPVGRPRLVTTAAQ